MSDAAILTPNGEAWDAAFAGLPHDIYHRAAYHLFAERMGEGRARLLTWQNGDMRLLWPVLLREHDTDGAVDATTVYGHAGPVSCGLDDRPEARATAWGAIRAALCSEGAVSLFTRFHPLLENAAVAQDMHGPACPPGGELLRLGASVSIDLGLDTDTRRMSYPQTLRQEIKRSERRGLSVSLDDELSAYGRFCDLYRETMARNAASERYLFSDSYLDGLRVALGTAGHLSVARLADGTVAGALLFTVHQGIATAHLTGIDGNHAALSPLKVLIDRTCDVARELGANTLHLGAGRGGTEDALFDFKARFSRRRHDFFVGRWILEPGTYADLAREAKSDEAYFPAYRAPMARQVAAP